jgi:hypothetical protein
MLQNDATERCDGMTRRNDVTDARSTLSRYHRVRMYHVWMYRVRMYRPWMYHVLMYRVSMYHHADVSMYRQMYCN